MKRTVVHLVHRLVIRENRNVSASGRGVEGYDKRLLRDRCTEGDALCEIMSLSCNWRVSECLAGLVTRIGFNAKIQVPVRDKMRIIILIGFVWKSDWFCLESASHP